MTEDEDLTVEDQKKTYLGVYSLLNGDQKVIFDTIQNCMFGKIHQRLFFIDGPGGTGKIFFVSI